MPNLSMDSSAIETAIIHLVNAAKNPGRVQQNLAPTQERNWASVTPNSLDQHSGAKRYKLW